MQTSTFFSGYRPPLIGVLLLGMLEGLCAQCPLSCDPNGQPQILSQINNRTGTPCEVSYQWTNNTPANFTTAQVTLGDGAVCTTCPDVPGGGGTVVWTITLSGACDGPGTILLRKKLIIR